VVHIIRNEERTAFTSLKSDPERQQFIKQFWEARGEAANQEHYRRIAYANQRFSDSRPGWTTDRGRIYILDGPPSQLESHQNQQRESWRYPDGRQYDFSGSNLALAKKDGPVQFVRIDVDRLAEPHRTELRNRLAPFTSQPGVRHESGVFDLKQTDGRFL